MPFNCIQSLAPVLSVGHRVASAQLELYWSITRHVFGFFFIYIFFLFIFVLFLLLCNQVRAVPEGPPIAEKMENLAMALHKQPLRSCTKPKHGAQSRKWPIMLITKTSAAKHWSKFPKHRLTDNGYFEKKKSEKQNQLKDGKWAKQTYEFFFVLICFILFLFLFTYFFFWKKLVSIEMFPNKFSSSQFSVSFDLDCLLVAYRLFDW